MNETNFWICDECGKKIESLDDGEVEWLNIDPNRVGGFKGLRIIHKRNKNCRYSNQDCVENDASPANLLLKELTEADGLMHLLRFLSDDSFQDKENVLEIIKRIHIPGYEKARLYFDEAIRNQVFDRSPDPKPSYCFQRDIAKILKYIDDQEPHI
jgi:hypothetical protein